MPCFSKIMQAWEWCFSPHENNPKHSKWAHPLFSFIFGISTTLLPIISITGFLEGKFPELKGEFPHWAKGNLPIALMCYMFLTIATRVKHSGPIAFYDFLWACNISLLLMIVGLLKESSLLISSSMILIAIDQVN